MTMYEQSIHNFITFVELQINSYKQNESFTKQISSWRELKDLLNEKVNSLLAEVQSIPKFDTYRLKDELEFIKIKYLSHYISLNKHKQVAKVKGGLLITLFPS